MVSSKNELHEHGEFALLLLRAVLSNDRVASGDRRAVDNLVERLDAVSADLQMHNWCNKSLVVFVRTWHWASS